MKSPETFFDDAALKSVTFTSVIRLRYLVAFKHTINPTCKYIGPPISCPELTTHFSEDYVDPAYWSGLEFYIGVICACMPTIRSLLRRYMPALIGQSTKSSLDGRWTSSRTDLKQTTAISRQLSTPEAHEQKDKSARENFVELVNVRHSRGFDDGGDPGDDLQISHAISTSIGDDRKHS